MVSSGLTTVTTGENPALAVSPWYDREDAATEGAENFGQNVSGRARGREETLQPRGAFRGTGGPAREEEKRRCSNRKAPGLSAKIVSGRARGREETPDTAREEEQRRCGLHDVCTRELYYTTDVPFPHIARVLLLSWKNRVFL